MSYTLFLLIFLAFVATAQKYDLEQRSNKLFGKGLSQVLQEFRDSPEYLKILGQKVSNWEKSAIMIFFSLIEDQTIKFIEDVENLDNVEISISTRRNMENNKNIFELLDEHSYAQFTSDEVSKLKNLAHEHFNMLLHSYMEALSPGSSNSSRDSLRSKHEPQFLEKGKRLVLNKSQILKIEVPKIPKHEMLRMQQKQSAYRQKELKKPEIPKPESPKTRELPEQKVIKKPEMPKVEVPKLPKQEMPRMEGLYGQKFPKELEIPKLKASNVPEMLKNKLQKQDGVSKQEFLKELEMMQLKKALEDSIQNVTFT